MKIIFAILSLMLLQSVIAQNNRVQDFNNINWIQLFVIKKLGKKTDLNVEYQLRRTNGIQNGQQGLFRTSVAYKPLDNVSFALGYAQVETFSYGDFPIAANGRFPEHRIFEQLLWKQSIQKFSITNRLRVEQRWLGKVKAGTSRIIEDWTYLNRIRYLLRVQYPLHKKIYAWVGDELFIGFGKNLGVNIFDQNRIHLNLGYKLTKQLNMEIGFFNQILQQGRLVGNNSIIQRNAGLTISSTINF
jgi:hypothetical protein